MDSSGATTYCRSGRRCSITNSGRPSFAGIRECETNRRRKFRRPHSPRFEMLSHCCSDESDTYAAASIEVTRTSFLFHELLEFPYGKARARSPNS